jgi:hypothetical protein
MPKTRPLASYSPHRRWTDADARIVLAALDALETTAEETRAVPAFVEVRHRAAELVEIVLRSGRVLRVPESIDAATLRRFIETLEQDPAC